MDPASKAARKKREARYPNVSRTERNPTWLKKRVRSHEQSIQPPTRTMVAPSCTASSSGGARLTPAPAWRDDTMGTSSADDATVETPMKTKMGPASRLSADRTIGAATPLPNRRDEGKWALARESK